MLVPNSALEVYHSYDIEPSVSVAIDDLFLTRSMQNKIGIFRTFTFSPEAALLGKMQSKRDINIKKMYEDGYKVVRRHTGGTLAWTGNTNISYSFFLNKELLDHRVDRHKEVFCWVNDFFIKALNSFGLVTEQTEQSLSKAIKNVECFSTTGFCELVSDNIKVHGGAYFSNGATYMQQGQILLSTYNNLKLHEYTGEYEFKEGLAYNLNREKVIKKVEEEFSKNFLLVNKKIEKEILEKAEKNKGNFEVV